VANVLRDHVVLELEAIDRMYLNVYVPQLQTVGAVVGYLRVHRGQRFASTAAVTPMTEAFVRSIERFVSTEDIDRRHHSKPSPRLDPTRPIRMRMGTDCPIARQQRRLHESGGRSLTGLFDLWHCRPRGRSRTRHGKYLMQGTLADVLYRILQETHLTEISTWQVPGASFDLKYGCLQQRQTCFRS
jgi:hypothetical protein